MNSAVEAAASGNVLLLIIIVQSLLVAAALGISGHMIKGWMRRVDGNISRIHKRFDDLFSKHLPQNYVSKDTCQARHGNGRAEDRV